jgi:predicted NAD-dependent protein-ADP-ribosyltransferase YbiA (DUF1768 family)
VKKWEKYMSKSFKCFPEGTGLALTMKSLIQQEEVPLLTRRISSRMVRLVSNLPVGQWAGWQMLVPTQGLADLSLMATAGLKASDLCWISEEAATHEFLPEEVFQSDLPIDWESAWVYEGFLQATEGGKTGKIGFAQESKDRMPAERNVILRQYRWPLSFSAQFGELVAALREEGGVLRYLAGAATPEAQQQAANLVVNTWQPCEVDVYSYIGTPVNTRLLFLLPHPPSARLMTIVNESVTGLTLRLVGNIKQEEALQAWQNPLHQGIVLPDYAARIVACEPRASDSVIMGIQTHTPPAKIIPARHTPSKASNLLRVGKATDISGLETDISLSEADLKRHWQIIGQTGTGKSSLLLSIMQKAILQGYGMTFFDPHGTTIDTLLTMIPEKHSRKVRVIRVEDTENPVPMNLWNTDDPEKAERSIADLAELFANIFDPRQEGIVGPRWERTFSQFAAASIALLGKRASLESIIALISNKTILDQAIKILKKRYPTIAQSLQREHLEDKSSEYNSLISWFVSKFQRFISVAQLRGTLGAGANAMDFTSWIDTNTVTLIDLGMPEIGASAARVVGTMLLQQLWTASLSRKNRERTHLVVMDEVQLFQTNPLPQMLAEARKFGLALIMAHQHTNQLSADVREAMAANTANFSAFHLSVKDAHSVEDRMNIPSAAQELSRMDAFRALTTLSIDGKQCPTFTLMIPNPLPLDEGQKIQEEIELRSIRELVDPYRGERPLTTEEVIRLISWAAVAEEPESIAKDGVSLLEQWYKTKQKRERLWDDI